MITDTKEFAMLGFGGVHLLMPQQNVAAVEAASSIDPASHIAGALGTLKVEGGEWPAFALNADLQPRAGCPSKFKLCVTVDCEVEALRRYLALERAA